MPLDIFKGVSKALGPLIAKRMDKKDFLDQLRVAWSPVVKASSDIEEEVSAALVRIKKSGFERTFRSAGITEDDVRQVLLDIQSTKGNTFRHNEPKVGRNEDCPCSSGRKFKKCCGSTS